VVVDAQQIDALMAKQRAEAQQAVEQENTAEEPAAGAPAVPGEEDKADAPFPAKEDSDNGKSHQGPEEKASEDMTYILANPLMSCTSQKQVLYSTGTTLEVKNCIY